MPIQLAEKPSRFITVDAKNNVHIMAPFNRGPWIGLDNTCQSAKALQEFIKGAPGKKNIIGEIDDYIAALKSDIALLEEMDSEAKAIVIKKSRLAQLEQYKILWTKLITPAFIAEIDGVNSTYPTLPKAINDALKAPNSNCRSIILQPAYFDTSLRLEAGALCTFSRDESPNGRYKLFKYRLLNHPDFKANFQTARKNKKNTKDLLINEIVNEFSKKAIKNNDDLNELKKLITKKLNIEVNALEKISPSQYPKGNPPKADYEYFSEDLCTLDEKSSIKEWAGQLLNGCIDDISLLIQQDIFQIVNVGGGHGGNFYDIDHDYGLFSIQLQLFLAVINIYHYELTKQNKNFGKMIEDVSNENSSIRREFFDCVLQEIRGQGDIRAAVFKFINSHKGTFFDKALTNEDIQKINNMFDMFWKTIVESPHYDEFLVLHSALKGDFYQIGEFISIPTSVFVKNQNKNLFDEFFNEKSKSSPFKSLFSSSTEKKTTLSAELAFASQALGMNEENVLAGNVIPIESLMRQPVDAIVRMLVNSIETLTEKEIEQIKESKQWDDISVGTLKSGLNKSGLEKFITKFKVDPVIQLKPADLQAMFTFISLKCAQEDKGENPLLGKTGLQKVDAALKGCFPEVKFKSTSFDESGNVLLSLNSVSEYEEATKKIEDFLKDNRTKFHVTSEMAVAFYEAFTQEFNQPNTQEIFSKLKDLNNQVKDAKNSKMAYAIAHLLHIPLNGVVSDGNMNSPLKPNSGQVKFEYYDRDGYIIYSSPETIKQLQSIFFERSTAYLSNDQVHYLLSISNANSIEVALAKNNIPFYSAKSLGEMWMINLEGNQAKYILEKICHKESIAEYNKKMKIEKVNVKFSSIFKGFELKSTYIEASDLFQISLNNESDRSIFDYLIENKAATKNENTIIIDSKSLLKLDPNQFRSKALELGSSSMVKEVKANALLLCKSLELELVTDVQDNNYQHFKLSSSNPKHREILKEFLRKHKNSCAYYIKNNQHYIKIKNNLFVSTELELSVKNILNRSTDKQKLLKINSAYDKNKNYKIVINESTLNRIKKYKFDLEDGAKLPGAYFNKNILQLGKSVKDLSFDEFLNLLIQTKIPTIFAESQILGNGFDWSQEEMAILGNVVFSVPDVPVFDNGKHHNPDVYQDGKPRNCDIIGVCGTLFANGFGIDSADRKRVVKNGLIDDEELYKLYEERLLPGFIEANALAKSSNQKGFIALPGLGCGQFAAEFKDVIVEKLQKVLARLLTNHADKLTNLGAIYFDPYQAKYSNSKKKINGIDLLCRPLLNGNSDKPQLCDPEHYDPAYKGYRKIVFCAADQGSYPANDMLAGSRETNEGMLGGATGLISATLGYPGKYNPDNFHFEPIAANNKKYATWIECIEDQGLGFASTDRVYLTCDEGVVKLDQAGNKEQGKFSIPVSIANYLALQLGLLDLDNPDDISKVYNANVYGQFLKGIGVDCKKIDINKQTMMIEVDTSLAEFNKLTEKFGVPIHLTFALASEIYMAVFKLGGGQEAELANLTNNPKPNKISKALELIGVKLNKIYFHDNNGYVVLIDRSSMPIIERLMNNTNTELMPFKLDIKKNFELFLEKSTSMLVFTNINKRTDAVINAIIKADTLGKIKLILQNQLDLANGKKINPDPSIVKLFEDQKWLTTQEVMPKELDKFKKALELQIQQCANMAKTTTSLSGSLNSVVSSHATNNNNNNLGSSQNANSQLNKNKQ